MGTIIVSAAWHFLQRPPGTLTEKWASVSPAALAVRGRAKTQVLPAVDAGVLPRRVGSVVKPLPPRPRPP